MLTTIICVALLHEFSFSFKQEGRNAKAQDISLPGTKNLAFIMNF
jgi:hypothetical protein